jgi:HicB family
MQLSTHIDALLEDLRSAGSLGDEAVAQAAQRLSETLQSSARLRLLDLLSEVTMEVSDQLPSGHVEIRLAGQEPSIVYVEDRETPEPAAAEDGMTARISLRLPESLKVAIEVAATRDGLSVNTWLVRELKRAAHRSAHKSFGSGLSGFAEA